MHRGDQSKANGGRKRATRGGSNCREQRERAGERGKESAREKRIDAMDSIIEAKKDNVISC